MGLALVACIVVGFVVGMVVARIVGFVVVVGMLEVVEGGIVPWLMVLTMVCWCFGLA